MKKKDIVSLVICLLIISVTLYFMLKMVFPSKNNTTDTVTNNEETQIVKSSWNINDEESVKTIKEVNSRFDYGEAALDGIGRANPFGPLN